MGQTKKQIWFYDIKKIKLAMKEQRYNIKLLSDATGISRETLGHILNKRQNAKVDHIGLINDVLGFKNCSNIVKND